MAKPILNRLLVAVIGVALLFATTPSIAAMECCDHAAMAGQMSDMGSMADMTHHGDVDQNSDMPCKMPASACVSICTNAVATSSTYIAFPYSAVTDAPLPFADTRLSGITKPPDLPPPILSA